MTYVYGVDTEKEVTPLMVRDALLQCFFEANCVDSGIAISSDENMGKLYSHKKVRDTFDEVGVDFDQPTKEGIVKVMMGLADFVKSFRHPDVIKKHFDEMMLLVSKLPEK